MRTRTGKQLAVLATMALLTGACGGAGESSTAGDRTPGSPATTVGFDGTTIKLGVLGTFSGPVAVIAEPVTEGQRAWFKHVNDEGGIAGKYKVELVEVDNRYSPDETVRQYNKIKSQVVALAQILGTSPTQAVLPLMKQDKMLGVPASLDSLWVREPNLLPVGAPYQIHAINSMVHFATVGGGSKDSTFCAMGQDDVYGEASLAGVEFAADKLGVEVASVQSYAPGSESFAGQVSALKRAKCDVVILASTPGDSANIWGTAAQTGFAPRWYGQPPSYVGALSASPLAPYMEGHVTIASEGGEWGDESVPGMAEIDAAIAKYAPDQKPDYYFMLGYNLAKSITAALEKGVEIGDLSRQGLLDASAELGVVSFGGVFGDYTYGAAEDRNPPRTTTMFAVDPSKPYGLAVDSSLKSAEAVAFQFDG